MLDNFALRTYFDERELLNAFKITYTGHILIEVDTTNEGDMTNSYKLSETIY